jgi:hypothetical protein
MMTPKEKAKDLVFKKFGCSKQYALIAVDEILNNNKILFEDVLNDQYWQEVKQEIELL